MGKVWGAVWSMLATVVAGMLLYTFQDPVRDRLVGQSVVAEVYVGPWTPYPRNGRPDEEKSGVGEINSVRNRAKRIGDDFPFAMISIRNRGYKAVENVTIDMRNDWDYDILIEDRAPKNPAAPRVLLDERELNIPVIQPNREYRIYMWSPADMTHQFLWDDARAFSSDGNFTLQVMRYDEIDSTDKLPWWMNAIEAMGSFILLCILLVLVCTLTWVLHVYERYIRKLFRNDDFYLAERIRFESEGKKFVHDTKNLDA